MNGDVNKLKIDYTINIGIVLHLMGLLMALFGILITLYAWKSVTDERLVKIEERQSATEEVNHQTQQLLYQQNERLARIEGKVDQLVIKKYKD